MRRNFTVINTAYLKSALVHLFRLRMKPSFSVLDLFERRFEGQFIAALAGDDLALRSCRYRPYLSVVEPKEAIELTRGNPTPSPQAFNQWRGGPVSIQGGQVVTRSVLRHQT